MEDILVKSTSFTSSYTEFHLTHRTVCPPRICIKPKVNGDVPECNWAYRDLCFLVFFVTHKTLHCSYSMLNSNFLIVAYITYQQSMYP